MLEEWEGGRSGREGGMDHVGGRSGRSGREGGMNHVGGRSGRKGSVTDNVNTK